MKENIVPLENVLSKISNLGVFTFNYKKGTEYDYLKFASGTQYGLIAQELEQIFPELVTTEYPPPENFERGATENDRLTYKGIKYIQLIPILTQAIKEQQVMIDELKKQVEELK